MSCTANELAAAKRYRTKFPDRVKAAKKKYLTSPHGRKVVRSYKRRTSGAALLKHRYGITPQKLETMRQQRGGLCDVCKQPSDLVIDHDHATGKLRGLLCHKCNLGLGHFRENVTTLGAAISYLMHDSNHDPH